MSLDWPVILGTVSKSRLGGRNEGPPFRLHDYLRFRLGCRTGFRASNNEDHRCSGQILLPDGNTPTESIRFELRGTDGSYDLRFTDSHGRFILERLLSDTSYTVFVPSNETTWGDTQIEFIPDQNADPRFYLAPLTITKLVRPRTLQAKTAGGRMA